MLIYFRDLKVLSFVIIRICDFFYLDFHAIFWLLSTIQSFIFLEYLEVFEYFGQDKNGRISTKQLWQAMRMVSLNPTDNQIQALINEKEFDGKRFMVVYNCDDWMCHVSLIYQCSLYSGRKQRATYQFFITDIKSLFGRSVWLYLNANKLLINFFIPLTCHCICWVL